MAARPFADACSIRSSRMAQPISADQQVPPHRRRARRASAIAAAGGAALGAALLLGAMVSVVPLRDGGFLRDDRLRHRGLLLIRIKEFHDGSDHPPAGHRRSIRRQPGGRPGVDAVGDGRIAKCGGPCRDRRSVSIDRPERPYRDRKEPAGPPDADFLRLYPLS